MSNDDCPCISCKGKIMTRGRCHDKCKMYLRYLDHYRKKIKHCKDYASLAKCIELRTLSRR